MANLSPLGLTESQNALCGLVDLIAGIDLCELDETIARLERLRDVVAAVRGEQPDPPGSTGGRQADRQQPPQTAPPVPNVGTMPPARRPRRRYPHAYWPDRCAAALADGPRTVREITAALGATDPKERSCVYHALHSHPGRFYRTGDNPMRWGLRSQLQEVRSA